MGFPGGSEGKESACNAGDSGSIPGSGSTLEKEMATHSSTLAWKIPWMEKPGRLQSTGLQKVRQDLATSLSPFHLSHGERWKWESPKEGNGNALQYSCLENPMDGKAW